MILQVDEIVDEFRKSREGNVSDVLFMKLAVVQNMCPALNIGAETEKFNPGSIEIQSFSKNWNKSGFEMLKFHQQEIFLNCKNELLVSEICFWKV